MAIDVLLNKQVLNNEDFDFSRSISMHDVAEHGTDFEKFSQRTVLQSALAKADEMRSVHNNMAKAFGVTMTAYKKTMDELAEAQKRIEELECLATTDEMTGLVNRRGFHDSFEKELDRTERGISAGGLLIMIDLDNFKMINDTYGHAAGDEALRLVAETLKHHIRRMDVAARFGGDEFVLLFANAGKTRALGRAQSLALKLNSLVLRWQGHNIPVRASIGIKDYGQGDQAETVFAEADATMYEAKEQSKRQRAPLPQIMEGA